MDINYGYKLCIGFMGKKDKENSEISSIRETQ